MINKIEKLEIMIKENINNKQTVKRNINNKLNDKIYNDLSIIKHDIDKLNQDLPMNNQLINIIIDKDKKIKEITDSIDIADNNKNENVNIDKVDIKIQPSLILNGITILSRLEDNYINATQLCQAGNKKFFDWYRLNTTKELIMELESEAGIPASLLIDSKKGNSNSFNQGTWIHPDLAIQLAQWVSPNFALQVSRWIRILFSNNNNELQNTLLLQDIEMKDKKIKLLQDSYLKKHKRVDYPEKNVIYILTTIDNKKNRIYIIGKAKELKKRLSTYNKTSEHEVVNYKECKSEEVMSTIENMILTKLMSYREKANRDRFVLPLEKDINFFISIVDECIKFFLKEIILNI